ncbi:hypothetical protein, partial [Bradyrhizobium huanghuaihaiense]|uniref:hypothetical protein n=1 Tax=Bradyrhizobium huanghuaihaiense TaxID=990078 RepID=UPI001ABF1D5B
SSSLLIRSKNPRRCQAENPLKLLSEFAGPALSVWLDRAGRRVGTDKVMQAVGSVLRKYAPATLTDWPLK